MAISRRTLIGSLGVASIGWPALVRAQPSGISDREILIGRIAPEGHPIFGDSARHRRAAADACIARVNNAGGIHGRKIRMVERDDSYSPEKAGALTQELIDQEGVFAMLGAFGSPTLPVIMGKVEAAGVPLVGAVSLSHESRSPIKRNVFPVRISPLHETAHVIRHQKTLGVERFAVLSSREAYGPEGLVAFNGALQEAGIKAQASIVFSVRDDPKAVARLLEATGAQALLVSALAKPFGTVMTEYRKLGGMATAFGFSAMRIEDLTSTLGPTVSGVGLSQATPVPTKVSVPLVKRYHEDMLANATGLAPSYQGLDSYLQAQVLVEGLRRAGRNLSRSHLVTGLESMTAHDFGGVMVKYGPGDRTGSTYVDIVMLGSNGTVVS